MDHALDYLAELEREDARIAGEMSTLDELAARAGSLRSRAGELSDFLERLPRERERIGDEASRTERDVAEAESAYEQAQAELTAAEKDGDEGRVASARRFERRTRDMVTVATRKRDQAHDAEQDLDRKATGVMDEVPQLVERAERLSQELSASARVSAELAEGSPGGLADVDPWGRQAQAAILVARAGLATERDSVVRQANEIGSAVLGESLGAASAATVARRVESVSGRAS